MAEKALTDYSDDEMLDAYRGSVTHVTYSSKDYWEELLRRQQKRLATALNWLTFVIAIATLVNAGAAVVLLVRTLGDIAGKSP
jgi:hypothetical protein